VVAKQGFGATTALTPMEQGPYFQAFTMEPATGIEPATCGLRNSANPTPGNLNLQETTTQADRDVVAGGPELSCPGSTVVAEPKRRERS
jgi:hypothetical protein